MKKSSPSTSFVIFICNVDITFMDATLDITTFIKYMMPELTKMVEQDITRYLKQESISTTQNPYQVELAEKVYNIETHEKPKRRNIIIYLLHNFCRRS